MGVSVFENRVCAPVQQAHQDARYQVTPNRTEEVVLRIFLLLSFGFGQDVEPQRRLLEKFGIAEHVPLLFRQ